MLTPGSFFAAALILLVGADAAVAGAWTRTKGQGFSSTETRYFRTGGAKDERFEQATVSFFAEYGLTEYLTAGLKVEQSTRFDIKGLGAQTGRAGGFARARVWSGEGGGVASIEAGGSIPFGGFQSPAAPDGDDANEFRASALYGMPLSTPNGDGWADGALGFAYFTGGRASEVKLDLTVGLRPTENWVAMAQMFGTLGLRNNRSIVDPDFDVAKVKLSVGRKVFGDKTLLIGLARDVYTRGTDPGWEASVTIWSPFDLDFSEWLGD